MRRFRKRKLSGDLKDFESSSSDNDAELLSPDISANEQILGGIFQNCADFATRPIYIAGKTKLLLVYIEGFVDTKTLDEVLLKPLLYEGFPSSSGGAATVGQIIEQKLIAITKVKSVSKVSEVVTDVLKANIAILIDGETKALLANMAGYEQRGIKEPDTEVTIRGPRDGFTESLQTNTSLLRRKIRSTRLKFESFTVGELSQTSLALAYIEGIAPDSLLEEIRKRIKRIKIDAVLESGYLEEFIEDVPYSPFPQIQNTERPDIVAANLLEGKVALITDNTPFVLVLPMTFWSGMQAVEDYYERFIYSTFIRFVRYFLFFIAMFLPSIFVALTTFHPNLIPTSLLISIAAAREAVPFPAIIEAIAMEFVFEGLREAGVRLPKAIGSAISIVGALVIGQSAVQAGIVSAPMVIVVATTGIASFTIPRYNLGTAIRLIRFPLLILAGMFGLYGIALGFIAITIHLVNLRSFGVPYFSPVAPQIPKSLKDVFVRLPMWSFHDRPAFIAGKNKRRIPTGQKPSPEQGGGNQ